MLNTVDFLSLNFTENDYTTPFEDEEDFDTLERKWRSSKDRNCKELDAIFDAEVLKTENVKMAAKVRQIWEATLEICLSTGKK